MFWIVFWIFIGGVEDVRCSVLRVEKLPASSAFLDEVVFETSCFGLNSKAGVVKDIN